MKIYRKSLFVLQTNFPTFRHNDFHAANILIQNLDTDLKHTVKYQLRQQGPIIYHDLMHCPYRILIWDMYFSSINPDDKPVYQEISSGPPRKINRYYDIHKLMDSIDYLFSHKLKLKVPKDLHNFIKCVLPDDYKCKSRGLTHEEIKKLNLLNIEHVTVDEVLQNPYFHELYKQPPRSPIIQSYVADSFQM